MRARQPNGHRRDRHDTTRFPAAATLASWAKFRPAVKESAGKTEGNAATGRLGFKGRLRRGFGRIAAPPRLHLRHHTLRLWRPWNRGAM
jgi:hypothetical protein